MAESPMGDEAISTGTSIKSGRRAVGDADASP